jgi:hypothetical protein
MTVALERKQGRTEEEEAFLRDLTLPVEDWPLEWRLKEYCGNRWFRSRNVVPIERYRQAGPRSTPST